MAVDRPATTPREISSRSAKLSANRGRFRDGGLMPPVGYMCPKMLEGDLPKTREIAISPEPCFHRCHSSALWAALYPTRWYGFLIVLAPRPQTKVRVALTNWDRRATLPLVRSGRRGLWCPVFDIPGSPSCGSRTDVACQVSCETSALFAPR